jgi:hypothetical protein
MARITPEKMPSCEMARVIVHWTAGTYKASALDREHYHILIEGDGTVVYGVHGIDANGKPVREPRASHTRNCNTGSIGVAVCCMKDAREKPFSAGSFPMTIAQWQTMAEVVGELCAHYRIPVTPRTVLAHGEVQAVLKIEQLQKWDPLVQPWLHDLPRQQVMDEFRAAVQQHVGGVALTAQAAASPFAPAPQDWPGDSAILLVHGVGNAKPGDYTDVVAAVRDAVGDDVAIYTLFYDVFNDWLTAKTDVKAQVGQLMRAVRSQQEADDSLAEAIAEFAGDVLWPTFSGGARSAILRSYEVVLAQMVKDGIRSTGKLARELKLSIICHSLGCFHTYEALHGISKNSMLKLRPFTDGVRFRSVVFMASPVQLLRTVTQGINSLVPPGLATLLPPNLSIPIEKAPLGSKKSVERWVSVTGDLDPIGGYFLRKKADWAYMNVAEPESVFHVDKQVLVGDAAASERDRLRNLLKLARSSFNPPSLDLNNPHSWLGYVERHKTELPIWIA